VDRTCEPHHQSPPAVTLKGLVEAGKVAPVIDSIHSLTEAPEAIRYLEAGHTHGKVVIAL
jgi:NADPH:quinone reductase-like Zn-dependent oxidoreductase